MKLFVGNLPYAATEADLTDFFSQAGVAVDSVNVMRDRFTGEARGFGFVEINDDTAANRAVEACNGRDLMGRALVVNEARPMVPREGGGGGRAPEAAADASAVADGRAGSTRLFFQHFCDSVRIVGYHHRTIAHSCVDLPAIGILQFAGVIAINVVRILQNIPR